MKRKITITGIITLFAFLLYSFNGYANKTSVKITAPEKAKKGTEITIKIEVSHSANTAGHHTDWVWVKVNGKEYKRWDYTKTNLPEAAVFTLEFTIKAEADMEIVAEGHCNRHGSKGPDTVTVKVE